MIIQTMLFPQRVLHPKLLQSNHLCTVTVKDNLLPYLKKKCLQQTINNLI